MKCIRSDLSLGYSEICLDRPLPSGTTCLKRPHSPGIMSYFIVTEPCGERPALFSDHVYMTNGSVFKDKFYCRGIAYIAVPYKFDTSH